LLSAVTASQPALDTTQVAPQVRTASVVEAAKPIEQAAQVTPTVTSITPLNLETYVRSYFAKTPILAEIARCESRFRQFGIDGQVLQGKQVPDDLGIMQVNAYFHEDAAEKLGFDLHTLDGNLAYGQWLYDREGTRPWNASKPCWGKSVAAN
jgi:hypothetical protein